MELKHTIAEFAPRLIIFDTLARLTPGGDENNAGQMGLAIKAIDIIRESTSASVLLVHHTRKAGKDGKGAFVERGSSALRGAADVMIECSSIEEALLVQLKCTKMKDAEPFKTISVGLERIDLGRGETSLATGDWKEVMETETGKAEKGQDKQAMKALDVLSTTFGSKGAKHGEWRDAFCEQTGSAQKTFNRALARLKADDAVRQEGSLYFPIDPGPGVSVKAVST
jgi:hypothetical protein